MGQLIPSSGTEPPPERHLSAAQRIEGWMDLMQFGDDCFLAGLKLRSPSELDELTAAKISYARYMEDQDQKLLRMARRFGARHGS